MLDLLGFQLINAEAKNEIWQGACACEINIRWQA
jgi:hypothetical protein